MIAVMTTVSGLALLFSYHTSTNSGTTLGASRLPTKGGSAGAGDPNRQAAPSPAAQDGGGDPTPTPTPKPKPKSTKPGGQFTGDTVDTRWGPVQVVIVVKNGKVVGADVIQVPHDNPRDQEINQVAVPILNQEVLDQQNPGIDGVSGATVTSDGYRQSLQSAFDRAHL